jgi:simple sugar transport system ATP-binding protein
MSAVAAADTVLAASGISHFYGSLAALRDVDIAVGRGEVVGLVGDNGAGKSTLLKILCGALRPTQGSLFVDSEEVSFHSPRESRDKGIEVVYQDLALATELSVAENIFLGREHRHRGVFGRLRVLDRASMASEARDVLGQLGIGISDVRARCGLLSGGERQAVAVARAVMWGQKVLLLDEPTAALAVVEQRKIEELVNEVKKRSVGVILVSHNLRQVADLCDRVHVLLHGRIAGVLTREQATPEELVRWITGVAVESGRAEPEVAAAELQHDA